MSADPWRCPKCGGTMEEGFVLDRTESGRGVSTWCPGPPKKSFWTGTKLPKGIIPVGTYRCGSCGFLESYARPEFAAK